jgi:polyisoprenoid-binding protein YceI
MLLFKKLLLVQLFVLSTSFAAKWDLDTSHSSVTFGVTHLSISNVKGQFKDFSAQIESEKEDLSDVKVNFVIQANSVDTGNEKRDKHLKNEDFFNVEKHKTITFESTKLEKDKDGKNILTGNLTMNGITKKGVTFNVAFTGPVPDPFVQGGKKMGVAVNGKVNRFDYGIKYGNNLVISEEVTLAADLEISKPADKKTAQK